MHAVGREIDHHIAQAARHEIELSPADFVVIGEDVYLDAMDPAEWLDAMTMD